MIEDIWETPEVAMQMLGRLIVRSLKSMKLLQQNHRISMPILKNLGG